MTYPVPTLEQVVLRARERARAETPGTDAAIWPNTQAVHTKALGGEAWEAYGFIEWVARQRFATTADGDRLDEIGEPIQVLRKPATMAAGTVDVVGTPLYSLLAGQLLSRSDGLVYAVDADTALDRSGRASVGVTAADVGPDYNLAPGGDLTPANQTDDISSITVSAGGIGGGAAIEDHESYRARILFRLRYPPHGGAPHDYVRWALEVPGITRVWVDPLAYGPGTIGVWIMADGNGSRYGVPMASELAAVIEHIEAVKPSTARPIVDVPVIAPLQVTVGGMASPTTAMQQRVEQELIDALYRAGQVSMPHALHTVRRSLLWQAVARATGDATHTINIPQIDVDLPVGFLPALATICYS